MPGGQEISNRRLSFFASEDGGQSRGHAKSCDAFYDQHHKNKKTAKPDTTMLCSANYKYAEERATSRTASITLAWIQRIGGVGEMCASEGQNESEGCDEKEEEEEDEDDEG